MSYEEMWNEVDDLGMESSMPQEDLQETIWETVQETTEPTEVEVVWYEDQTPVEKPERNVPQTIPALRLYLKDVTLEEINSGSKSIKYDGNRLLLEVDGTIEEFEEVQIKGRGNSTWDWSKKPYQIKFSEKVDLFDMGASKKWVLLANYRDVSLLRNEAALYLANRLGDAFPRFGQFVELYVDDAYVGLYYVTHKVELGSSTVDLEDPMGVLVEIDEAHDPDDIAIYSQLNQTCILLSEAVEDDDDDLRKKALESFGEAFDRLEKAAAEKDWEAVCQEIDVNSFVEYYLVNEFSANPDGFASSFYMYRDGEQDVIHAGPVWDFDMAFANVKYTSGDASSPYRSWVYADPRELRKEQEAMLTELFAYLMEIPQFRAAVETCYQTRMKEIMESLPAYLQEVSELILEEAEKDQDKWHTSSTFLGDLKSLQNWLSKRMTYMDLLYAGRVELPEGIYTVVSEELSEIHGMVWQWYLQQDGTYRITDTDTGLVLSLEEESSIVAGEPLCWKTETGSDGQSWIFVKNENGGYLMSKMTGLVVSMDTTDPVMYVEELGKAPCQTIDFEQMK